MALLYNRGPDLIPTTRVEAEGSKQSKIAIIGEAPGAKEVQARRPFVGPSGNLLNQLLQGAGIIRSDCYITNLIKEQPPKTGKKSNDISVFLDVSKKSGAIETDAYKEYKEELRLEIEKTDCNILVAMGNAVLYALTDIHPPSITKRRGSIYECTLVPGRKVMACIHPAACLHSVSKLEGQAGYKGGMYIWKHFIRHDLQRAKEESVDRIVKRNDFEYVIRPSYMDSKLFLENILDKCITPVAFDIEVVNLEVSCISFAYDYNNEKVAISIPFTADHMEYMSVDQEMEIWNVIAKVIESPDIVKVGQNLVFDTQFLFRSYGIAPPLVEGILEDTMIAQGVLVPDFPKGLDFITSIYTNEPYYKDEGKKHFSGATGDDRSFWLYNAKDSAICIDALPKQLDELRQLGNIQRYRRQTDLIPILAYMSERGIRMDVEGMKEKSVEVG